MKIFSIFKYLILKKKINQQNNKSTKVDLLYVVNFMMGSMICFINLNGKKVINVDFYLIRLINPSGDLKYQIVKEPLNISRWKDN